MAQARLADDVATVRVSADPRCVAHLQAASSDVVCGVAEFLDTYFEPSA
jgi:hypothetical protein